jgi:hypothetical protein
VAISLHCYMDFHDGNADLPRHSIRMNCVVNFKSFRLF